MIVRGTCQCFLHMLQCVPLTPHAPAPAPRGMRTIDKNIPLEVTVQVVPSPAGAPQTKATLTGIERAGRIECLAAGDGRQGRIDAMSALARAVCRALIDGREIQAGPMTMNVITLLARVTDGSHIPLFVPVTALRTDAAPPSSGSDRVCLSVVDTSGTPIPELSVTINSIETARSGVAPLAELIRRRLVELAQQRAA